MMGTLITSSAVLLHWGLALGLIIRILMRRRPRGSSLAWIAVTLALPYVGAALYLIVGEVWLPRSRVRRVAAITQAERATRKDALGPSPRAEGIDEDVVRVLSTLAERASGIGLAAGNGFEVFSRPETILGQIVRDIDGAESSCFILTYIWQESERTAAVAAALARAAARGVDCRVLADSHGSRMFLDSETRHRLEQAGVAVQSANETNWLRVRLSRLDMRNHRKIVVIDRTIAYTGSFNIIDPATFKADAGVGRWIDCMVRLRGPAALDLQHVFFRDWFLALPEADFPQHLAGRAKESSDGGAVVQVLPSGPAEDPYVLRQVLLSMIHSARERVIVTTPYFVPDEAMMLALTSAARGGVEVHVTVPEKGDAALVQLATRSYFQDLLDAGASVHLFKGGLLHSKIITVDGQIGMIGTANMDLRSFEINLEVSLLTYDIPFTGQLARLQQSYIEHSVSLDPADWANRSWPRRLLDNAAQLIAPIL